eukprot:12243190-Ditylum_brightwellii.AAC.1
MNGMNKDGIGNLGRVPPHTPPPSHPSSHVHHCSHSTLRSPPTPLTSRHDQSMQCTPRIRPVAFKACHPLFVFFYLCYKTTNASLGRSTIKCYTISTIHW